MKMKRWHWVRKRLVRWTASLTLVVLLAKRVGGLKMFKRRLANAHGVFYSFKKVWMNRKIILPTKIRILEATVMTVVKCGSEEWALQKAFAKCFSKKFLTDCFGYLTD